MFYGFFLRALFGPKKKKSGFFEVRFDPISLIYVLIARGSNAVSIDQILSFGLNVGARIGLGKRAALMPYLGFSTYNFPYLGVVSGIYPRYYSPELGIKFALE